ncbi:MAG: Flp family type IVb pilin [Bacillota bacterium]|nr:MAG: Flp family type IVb pilin [Bacillota bacterium]
MMRLFAWWEGFKHRLRDERGQGMVEYGLIIALVAVVVIAALGMLGNKLDTLFRGIEQEINTP